MISRKTSSNTLKTVILFLSPVLLWGFVSACGPGTFFGTWSDILSGEESEEHAPSGKISGRSSLQKKADGTRQVKRLNLIQIFGVQNRQGGLLLLANNAETGFSVAAGDIDGDRVDDLILGAPESEGILPEKTTRSGWVYVIKGRKNWPSKVDLGKLADLGFWGGEEVGRNLLGHALACSDLNGDGIADLIIGVPHGNAPGDHRIHAGVVYVIFGRQTLTGIIDLSKQADITILGADEGDLTGFSLATGDINGDHLSDLIIGAPGGDGYREKTPDAGETYLIYGRSRFPKSIDLAKNWNSRIFGVESRSSVDLFGENEPDNSGYAVAASDLNHDGLQDIIIGAPFADGFLNKETDAGESYVIFGKTKLPKNIRLSNQANITLYGSRRRDHSGQSLIRGDVNGDKIDDVIISSPGAVRKPKSGAFKGLLHAIFGKSDHPKKYHLRKNASMVFKSSSRHRCEEQALSSADEATMVFGRSLIALDLDQDGRDDLVAGDPCARGRMGKSQSGEIGFYLAREKQRLTRPTAVFQPEKTKSNEYFGFSLSRGDVNGDGRMDIIAGAPGMPRRKGLSTSGGAYVILGLSPK